MIIGICTGNYTSASTTLKPLIEFRLGEIGAKFKGRRVAFKLRGPLINGHTVEEEVRW